MSVYPAVSLSIGLVRRTWLAKSPETHVTRELYVCYIKPTGAAVQSLFSRAQAASKPRSRSHGTDDPRSRSHGTDDPRSRSHGTDDPRSRSHGTDDPRSRSRGTDDDTGEEVTEYKEEEVPRRIRNWAPGKKKEG